MKLIVIRDKIAIKECIWSVERDRDLIHLYLKAYALQDVTLDMETRKQIQGFDHSIIIEKKMHPDLYTWMKDMNQEKALKVVYDSMLKYFDVVKQDVVQHSKGRVYEIEEDEAGELKYKEGEHHLEMNKLLRNDRGLAKEGYIPLSVLHPFLNDIIGKKMALDKTKINYKEV